MNLRRAAWTSGIALGLLVALIGAAHPAAAAGPNTTTFVDIVRTSKLIVLVDIHVRADGGYTLDVESVFKGSAPAQLQFAPTPEDALEPGWARAVVAFRDPTTLDFRAPTIAWHVAADGRIDPEGLQQYPGVPPTLDAMIALFGGPAATASAEPTPAASITGGPADEGPQGGWPPIGAALVIAGLLAGAALVAIVAWERSRRSSQ